MNRRMFSAILASAPILAIAGEAEDDLKRLEGTWRFVSLEADGQRASADAIKEWRWMVRGQELTWVDPVVGRSKTSVGLDPAATPRAIDLTSLDGPEKGKRVKGIYEFKGDRLTICLGGGRSDGPGRPRPEAFQGGDRSSLIVLERVEAR